MTEFAHVQVARMKHNMLSSKKFNNFNRRSLQLSCMVKLTHQDYHRKLQSQYTNHSEGFDTIPRKIVSMPNSSQQLGEKSIDFNESMQSISVNVVDSNRAIGSKPMFDTKMMPVVNIKRDSSNFSAFQESHQSKYDVKKNHSKSKSQNICADRIQIIKQRSNRKDWPNLSHEQRRKKKQGSYCTCSPICKLLLLIGLIFFGTMIAAILTLSLLFKDTTTTKTTTMTTTTTATTSTTVTTTTTTTAIPCRTSCTAEQNCVSGLCMNVGYLACTLTWSRPGDGDIVVTTPNNRTISYKNRGPSINTDGGQLDIDDQNGIGPENVYWATSGAVPPNGTYYVCFEPYTILPLISPSNPVTVVYQIIRPLNNILIFTRTFTSVLQNSYSCDSNSTTLIGSFRYP